VSGPHDRIDSPAARNVEEIATLERAGTRKATRGAS
jgi:hypothetical protein